MKNIIIAVLATISCLSAIGQSGQRPLYLDDYLYPYYMASGCYDTNDFDQHYGMHWNCDPFPVETIIAQPFYIDSAISIRGIAAFVRYLVSANPVELPHPVYLQIRDSSLNNVLAQIRYDTMIPKIYHFQQQYYSWTGRYIEALFDSIVTISSSVFYVGITFLEKNYNWAYEPFEFQAICKNLEDCNGSVREFPVLVGDNAGNWKPILQALMEKGSTMWQDTMNVPYEMRIFPILKRATSSLDEIDIDNRVKIYPNPSSKEININSQYIINSIEILNSLGQKVYSEKINALNKTIDISALNKGIYIIELKTEKGVIHRKFIKE
ncbi:MAG: T9SS type A sorting domain-containing protein [Tissierellia bacterium]|nr:T9SS type A sorting domain-containing protein [Tissierellia bacterium]